MEDLIFAKGIIDIDGDIISRNRYKGWANRNTSPPPPPPSNRTNKQFEKLKAAMRQIADCDTMDSDEYEAKYGGDADRDPYVIAQKAMENIDG